MAMETKSPCGSEIFKLAMFDDTEGYTSPPHAKFKSYGVFFHDVNNNNYYQTRNPSISHLLPQCGPPQL